MDKDLERFIEGCIEGLLTSPFKPCVETELTKSAGLGALPSPAQHSKD